MTADPTGVPETGCFSPAADPPAETNLLFHIMGGGGGGGGCLWRLERMWDSLELELQAALNYLT
jgi:hypothetical protein